MEKENCVNCDFSLVEPHKQLVGRTVRVCRRFPPAMRAQPGQKMPNGSQQINFVSHFPVVSDTTWCGEYLNMSKK